MKKLLISLTLLALSTELLLQASIPVTITPKPYDSYNDIKQSPMRANPLIAKPGINKNVYESSALTGPTGINALAAKTGSILTENTSPTPQAQPQP